MKNNKNNALLEKTRISLDKSLKVLDEAELSLKALDNRILKTQETIQLANFCIANTQKLLNSQSASPHQHNSTLFKCAKYDLPHDIIRQQLVLELRYFGYCANQLSDSDPYYSLLNYHYRKLANKLNETPSTQETIVLSTGNS
jgi:hypothetical protein